eukprot:8763224-Lingulodinium_polyedra.AAC.1
MAATSAGQEIGGVTPSPRPQTQLFEELAKTGHAHNPLRREGADETPTDNDRMPLAVLADGPGRGDL